MPNYDNVRVFIDIFTDPLMEEYLISKDSQTIPTVCRKFQE